LLPGTLEATVNPLEEDEGNAWPDEPDEFDPDDVGPETPDSTPTLRESFGAAADVSEDLFRAFWASVLFLNVALAALSIGAMLVYFRGDYASGGPALLVGTVAAFATARYYWRVKTGRYSQSDADDGERDTEGSEPADSAAARRSEPTDGSETGGRTDTERGSR